MNKDELNKTLPKMLLEVINQDALLNTDLILNKSDILNSL